MSYTPLPGSARDPEVMPTQRQGTVLWTLEPGRKSTAREIGVRSDVLWRMEQRGWVSRTMYEVWYINPAGREALERWKKKRGMLPADDTAHQESTDEP